jgi:hypothetical protein
MHSMFSLELIADDVKRERFAEAAHDALIAQLPHSTAPRRPDLAARSQVANTLRALAVRLDPCALQEPALAGATPR